MKSMLKKFWNAIYNMILKNNKLDTTVILLNMELNKQDNYHFEQKD